MTLPGGWFALACRPWHQGGVAQHRDAGQRGWGAPIRGASAAGKTEYRACAALPTARACGSTRHRGHREQSPRPVRLHSASTGCAPRGSLPDSPETDTYRALHRAHRGDGAYGTPRDIGPLSGEKQEAYQRGSPAVTHGGARSPHPLGSPLWRRQPPPGEVVRARSMAPFRGGRVLKVEMVDEIRSHRFPWI